MGPGALRPQCGTVAARRQPAWKPTGSLALPLLCTLQTPSTPTHLLSPSSLLQVRIVNADVGVLVAGSDFVTLSGLVLQTSEPRGILAAEGLAGHLGLRVQQSSGVLASK